MSEENATQNAMAEESVESAPTQEQEVTPAVNAEPAPAEEPGETPTAEDGAAPATVQDDENGDPEAGNEPTKVVKELITQRKKRQELERQVAYLQGQLESGKRVEKEQPAPAPTNEPPPAPDIKNFESYEQFEAANRRYLVDLAKYEFRMEADRQSQEQQVKQAQQSFQGKLAQAAQVDPEFAELQQDEYRWRSLPVSTAMRDVLYASDSAPALLKYLDANRAEAAKMAAMSPALAARALALIEAKMTAKAAPAAPPRRVSQAPQPVSTVKPTSVGTVDEDQLPIDEWMRRRNEAARKR